MRSAREIRPVCLVGDVRIPHVTVAVERAHAMAVDRDVVAAHDERGGLVLVADV